MLDQVNDRLRKLVDNSQNVQGFIIHHAVGGGTGSGLGALILERIAVDYRKKSKLGFEIYPSPKISTCIVEPYNAMLTTHWLLDHTEVSMVLDNEAIYAICQKQLDVDRPSYADLNMLIAKVVSSMTAALRFDGELNVDLGSSFFADPSATAATFAANSAATPLELLLGFSADSGAGVELVELCSGVEAGGGTCAGVLEVPSTDTSCLVLGSMIAILFLVRFRVFCADGG